MIKHIISKVKRQATRDMEQSVHREMLMAFKHVKFDLKLIDTLSYLSQKPERIKKTGTSE